MTKKEKKDNPSHETTEGYLKPIPFKTAFKDAWHNWNKDNRDEFKKLPNFNKKIFYSITGVKL